MSTRPRQTDCRSEPAYPDHETVVWSLGNPELVVHRPAICGIQSPHRIDECAEFQPASGAKGGE